MTILQKNCLDVIPTMLDASIQLLWTDPPFGTGNTQRLKSTKGTDKSYRDLEQDQAVTLVTDMMRSVHPKLLATATVAICMDWRAVHETKVAIEQLGLYQFEHELIYHFELGGVSRNWWTNKHNTILLWSLGNPIFHLDQIPHVNRAAKRGDYQTETRRANSVLSITMGSSDSQRTGYPNQKPLALIEPFIRVHTNKGDVVLDPFAGSGTVGVAADQNNRDYILCDISGQAVQTMRDRGLR